jgi:two-component system cell cycle sensor histidine kinase/response regulator CckA
MIKDGSGTAAAGRAWPFQRLFDDSPLPILVVDAATLQILDVNPATTAALGYSLEELRSMRTPALTVPDDPEQAARLAEVRSNHAPTIRFGPLNYRKKDGSFMRAVGSSYVVDHDGRSLRVAMLEDVTEKEKIERQMQQAQRLESLGQLAGGVAHDFNNLLTVILNVTAALKQERLGEYAARDVERIEKAAHSASRLTHQLLAFARRDLAAQEVLDINAEMSDLKELLSRTIGSHVRLSMEPAMTVWPVLMDRGRLEQVVINLAVNARDAMPGGGRLVISTANVTVDDAYAQARPGLRTGDYVRLEVADTGTGMDKKVLEHAFEPFFTTKPVGQGTGLGLATVYGIVKQARGHIAIYSEVGRGTTVSVLVPRSEQPVRHEVAAPPPSPRPASGTVLVVEDYPDLRELFEEILTQAGYRVLVAADGAEAIAVAGSQKDDIGILLTDIVMPNMLGPDLARELQLRHPDMRVLFMSGHAQAVIDSATPLPPGAKLLQKPFLEAELLARLAEVLTA